MKAVTFERHGGLEELRYTDVPEPDVGAGDVLVRVRAVALNGFDPMILQGIPGLRTPLPMIPGGDIAGEVAALGSAVDPVRHPIGSRVTVMPLMPPEGMMGETLTGGAAEYVAVPERFVIPIPTGVSDVDAAALPIAYGTALRMMVTRGHVRAGERVLVLGATGGVGTCCVQLAKLAGAEVIACAGTAAKAERLRALGADHAIDTSQQDFVAETLRICGKPRVWGASGGVDAIVNYIGGDTWRACLKVLKRDGRMLTCGATAGYEPPTDLRYIWSFEQHIIGSNGWTIEDQRTLLDMVASKRLAPAIDSVRPLAQWRDALEALIERRVFGKAVLTV